MKTPQGLPSLLSIRHYQLIAIAGFVLALIAIGLPIHSVESHSRRPARGHSASAPRMATARSKVEKVRSKRNSVSSPAVTPFTGPALESFSADCTTPNTNFVIGDTVCLKVSGIPVNASFPHRLVAGNANTTLIELFDVTSDPQTFTFVLTATSTIGGATVDNRGTWRAVVYNPFFFFPETNASFTVDDPANPTADIAVATVLSPSALTPGSQAIFDIQAKNYGPDNSANVQLTNSVPAGTTFVSFQQLDGPTFNCTTPNVGDSAGTTTCTLASFAWPGPVATFRAIYQVDSAAAINSQISNTADIVSGPTGGTGDENSLNNSTTSTLTVVATGGSATCILTCPEDLNAVANTTEGTQRGAHVTFDSADTSGTCGAITASPASGSFFPVGTTTVTVTSETGGGSCSFTVTVEDNGTNPPTISCPASQETTADSNCVANVYAGTATATGDNVTITASRSDGKAMYTCDVNGTNCTRNSTDFPFPAGITTITWIARAHDVAGPYASEDDEIAHRTGASSCTQTITVNDVTPPSINAPNTSASADANCLAPVPDYSTLATVSDNCACDSNTEDCQGRQTITITQSPAPGTLVGLGATTVTLTANDGSSNNGGAGNSTTIQVTFTVSDTTAPTFTFVPAAVTAFTGSGATTCDTFVSNATIGTATATDNCSTPTVVRSPAGNTFPVGTTTITWTATDAAGNHSTAQQTVTVIDNTPPAISCPASLVLEPTCPTGAVATWTPPVGTDNCPGAITTRTAGGAPGSVFPIGTTTVTYSVTDASNNSVSCSFTVTVKTPQQVLQDMINTINGYSNLSGTQKQGLISKLQAALDAINQGKPNVACNKLGDFNSQVSGFISNGTLTSAQGNALLSSSNHVRNTIGCTTNPCT